MIPLIGPAAVPFGHLCVPVRGADHFDGCGEHELGRVIDNRLHFVREGSIEAILSLVMHATLAQVKDTGNAGDHRFHLILEAGEGDVLQGPVPVVVIVRAKGFGTVTQLGPGGTVKHKAHVVT